MRIVKKVQEAVRSESTKEALKVSGYVVLATGVVCTVAFATSDFQTQVGHVQTAVFGPVASIIVGGGLAVGGGVSVYQGNIAKGMGQLAIAALVGIGVAISKSGGIFSAFG